MVSSTAPIGRSEGFEGKIVMLSARKGGAKLNIVALPC